MPHPLIPFLRFHFQRTVRVAPVAAGVLAVCIALATIAGAALLSQANRADAAQTRLAVLRATVILAQASKPVMSGLSLEAHDLPPFDSAKLVTILNETAADSSVLLDEVTYALDANVSQPYLRYRITMTLNGTYPLIRRLTEQLNTHVPNLTLDAISCSRKDAAAPALSCDVAMSGLFEKAHGG